jgi:hypothetical protein
LRRASLIGSLALMVLYFECGWSFYCSSNVEVSQQVYACVTGIYFSMWSFNIYDWYCPYHPCILKPLLSYIWRLLAANSTVLISIVIRWSRQAKWCWDKACKRRSILRRQVDWMQNSYKVVCATILSRFQHGLLFYRIPKTRTYHLISARGAHTIDFILLLLPS